MASSTVNINTATGDAQPEAQRITVSLAKRPHAAHHEGETLNEERVHSLIKAHVARLEAKYKAHHENYKRNTDQDHPFSIKCARRDDKKGTQMLVDVDQDTLWTAKVTFGSEPIEAALDVDTGSSDTVVQPHLYHPERSATSEKTGKTFSTSYGDGTKVKGDVYHDTVSTGGMVAQRQAFGSATQSTLSPSSQGILGLAFQSISDINEPPFFDSLIAQGKVREPVFGFGLWSEGARFDLGHLPREAYRGEISWSEVNNSTGYWITKFDVDGLEAEQVGMIDTGTTLLLGPFDEVKKLIVHLGMIPKEQDGQIYGVYKVGQTPHLTLSFNGHKITIDDAAMQYQKHGDLIVAGIVGVQMQGTPGWILGGTFLRSVYAAFDKGPQLRVGFAARP